MDIKDLDLLLENINDNNLKEIFSNLRKGSLNHLNAFSKQYEKY
jgi:hypothetical protein